MEADLWKRCSSCKGTIGFGARHWICNVSTCNRPRTGLFFCSVSCWEAHVPVMRHRESWALERLSPTREEWARVEAAPPAPAARANEPSAPPSSPRAPTNPRSSTALPPSSAPAAPAPSRDMPREILIVASKLKGYVRARSGMNTSDNVLDVLSDSVRALCDEAIRSAQRDGRKTVMDRDFPRRR
jgi:hypothetical protein